MSEQSEFNPREAWKQPIDSRRTPDPQLWIVGCSLAHGYGIESNQRYGDIVARELDMQVSWLTMPASGIDWAADQILRADIQANDIVIWGITGVNRRVWFKDGEIKRLCTGTIFGIKDRICHANQSPTDLTEKSYLLDLLLDPANVYHAIRYISQVQNFCEKIKARLLILFHREMSSESDSILIDDHINDWPDLVNIGRFPYLDRAANDPMEHPGPKTNRDWADKILNHLKNIAVS